VLLSRKGLAKLYVKGSGGEYRGVQGSKRDREVSGADNKRILPIGFKSPVRREQRRSQVETELIVTERG
jgi:hypothetical protein